MKMRLTRRALLRGVGAGVFAGAVRGPAWAATARTPSQGEGPFYPVGWTANAGPDLIGIGHGAVRASGQPLALSGRVLDAVGRPLAGVRVEIWQCDHRGVYRHPRDRGRGRVDAGFRGFGAMSTDLEGGFTFHTIVPVPYPGRPPHIHAKLKRGSQELLTTQLYLKGNPSNRRDGLLSFLGPGRRAALMLALRESVLHGRIPAMAATFDFGV